MKKHLFPSAIKEPPSEGSFDLHGSHVRVSLDAGTLFSLDGDARGVEISSLDGAVWVTQQDDPCDHVVTARAGFVIGTIGRVVVQAIEDASIAIAAAFASRHGMRLNGRHGGPATAAG